MKSQNASKSTDEVHSQVTLNKLHFDLRNAKPFVRVLYHKSDTRKAQTDTVPVGNGKQGKCKLVSVQKCSIVDTNDGQVYKAGLPVQVDDNDSDRPADMSKPVSAANYSSTIATDFTLPEEHCSSPLIAESTCLTAQSQLSHEVPPTTCPPPCNNYLVTDDSSVWQTPVRKQKDFSRCRKQSRQQNWTENTAVEKTSSDTVADDEVASIFADEQYPCNENVDFRLDCISHRAETSYGCSSYSVEDMSPSQSTTRSPSSSQSKKSFVSEHSLASHVVPGNDITDKPVFQHMALRGKHAKHSSMSKRKIKTDPDYKSSPKNLLLSSAGKKCVKSGLGRKRRSHVKDIFAVRMPIWKRRGRKPASMKGMELPDLSQTCYTGSYSASDVERKDVTEICDWKHELADNTAAASQSSKKWYIDITGSDLISDSDGDDDGDAGGKSVQRKTDKKSKTSLEAEAECQNVNPVPPQCPTDDAELHIANITDFQETPPPSVASDGFGSSCEELDEPVACKMDEPQQLVEGSERAEVLSDSRWLVIDMKRASYINGWYVGRSVSGTSVQVSRALSEEAAAQIGSECLQLAKLSRRDLRELREQIRLEELYHQRATRAMQSLQSSEHSSICSFSDAVPNSRAADQLLSYMIDPSVTEGVELNTADEPVGTGNEVQENDMVPWTSSQDEVALQTSDAGAATGDPCRDVEVVNESDDGTVSYVSSDEDEASTDSRSQNFDAVSTAVPSVCHNEFAASEQKDDVDDDNDENVENAHIRIVPGADFSEKSEVTRAVSPDHVSAVRSAAEHSHSPVHAPLTVNICAFEVPENSRPNDFMNDSCGTVCSGDTPSTNAVRLTPMANGCGTSDSDDVVSKPDVASNTDFLEFTVAASTWETNYEPVNVDGAGKCETAAIFGFDESVVRFSAVDKNHCQPASKPSTHLCAAPISALNNCFDSECMVEYDVPTADDSRRASRRKKPSRSVKSRRRRRKRTTATTAADQLLKATNCVEPNAVDIRMLRPTSDDNEYTAALALASLSLFTETRCLPTHLPVLSVSEASAQPTPNHYQTSYGVAEKACELTGRHISDIAEPSNAFLHSCLREQCAVSQTPDMVSSAKLGDRKDTRNGYRPTDNKTGSCPASPKKKCERSRKRMTDLGNKLTTSTFKDQTSGSHRSDSGRRKQVQKCKQMLSTTCSSKSDISNDNDVNSLVVSAAKLKNADVVSQNLLTNCTVIDNNTKHRKDGRRKRDRNDKKTADSQKLKHMKSENSVCNEVDQHRNVKYIAQPISNNYDAALIVDESDVLTAGENVSPLHDPLSTSSATGVTNTSVPHCAVPQKWCILPPSSPVSDNLLLPADVYSEIGTSISTAIVGMTSVDSKSSLPNEYRREKVPDCDNDAGGCSVAGDRAAGDNNTGDQTNDICTDDHAGDRTGGAEGFSDTNGNDLSMSSHLTSDCGAVEKRSECRVPVTHNDADVGMTSPVLRDEEYVLSSCSGTRSKDDAVSCTVRNSSQRAAVVYYDSPESPHVHYREVEDIRSPSPLPADLDSTVEEIRSPSPCNVQSPLRAFHVIETSWEVQISSPCEIQSPDASDDERDDSVERYRPSSRRGVCYHDGPATIPLTIEEANKADDSTTDSEFYVLDLSRN